MKKVLSIVACVVLLASMASICASAREMDPVPYLYTSQGPTKGAANTIMYETFDDGSTPESIGFYPGYTEDSLGSGDDAVDYIIPQVSLELSSTHARSGKALHVYNRNAVYDSAPGEHTFLYTNNYPKTAKTNLDSTRYCVGTADGNKSSTPCKLYSIDFNTNIAKKDMGSKIKANYTRTSPTTTDWYYFQAWVYSDTAQTFLPKLQYGYTNELWIPLDDYWEVPAKTWTLIGGLVKGGTQYYGALLADGPVSYGLYPPGAATTNVRLSMATKSKTYVKAKKPSQKQDAEGYRLDEDGNRMETVAFTTGDYYLDDVAIWKVTDKSKLYNLDKDSDKMIAGGSATTKAQKKTTAAPKPTTNKKPVSTKKPVPVKTQVATNANGEKVVVKEETEGLTGNGKTKEFSLKDKKTGDCPVAIKEIKIDGKVVDAKTYKYDAKTGMLTFNVAPADGKKIVVTTKEEMDESEISALEASLEESLEGSLEESLEESASEGEVTEVAPTTTTKAAEEETEKGNLTWLWIVIAAVVAAGGGTAAFLLTKKGKKA